MHNARPDFQRPDSGKLFSSQCPLQSNPDRLTAHDFAGLVRQLTRGMPSLVPVPRKMIWEDVGWWLPLLSIPSKPSTNAPGCAAFCTNKKPAR
jgi:hypothetical protein